MMVVVIVNIVFLGAQVQLDAEGKYEESTEDWLEAVGCACCIFYIAELGLRVAFEPTHRLLGPRKRGWFILDCVLVLFCIMELLLLFLSTDSTEAVLTGRLVRTLRLVKVTRVLKIIPYTTELRAMVTMILTSFSALFWLFVLLFAMVYVFAIILTQAVVDYLDSSNDDLSALDLVYRGVLQSKFTDLPRTMETLFACTTGAEAWNHIGAALRLVNPGFYIILIIYMFFTFFSVLNIVNGVFVDSAIQHSKHDRDLVADKKAEEDRQAKQECLREFKDILRTVDDDDSDTLTLEEFLVKAESKAMVDLLDSLEVDIEDAEHIFRLLDVDGNGHVNIEEFVQGVLKLRPEVTSFDMHLLMFQNRQLLKDFASFKTKMEDDKQVKYKWMAHHRAHLPPTHPLGHAQHDDVKSTT